MMKNRKKNTGMVQMMYIITIVPNCGGDSYYNFTFTPFDENYLPIEGHFYVYGETNFGRLNLSDSGRIPYLKKSYITVKGASGYGSVYNLGIEILYGQKLEIL